MAEWVSVRRPPRHRLHSPHLDIGPGIYPKDYLAVRIHLQCDSITLHLDSIGKLLLGVLLPG